MRWMPVIMGIGIITAGCGSESTGSGGSSSGDSTATTGASSSSGGQGGSGGSGGSSATSSTSGTTSSSTTGATSSASSSSSSSSSTGTGMGAVFGATCAVNADCASGLCANFVQKGMHCSVKCTTAAECPPESTGCGGQGVCKPPA